MKRYITIIQAANLLTKHALEAEIDTSSVCPTCASSIPSPGSTYEENIRFVHREYEKFQAQHQKAMPPETEESESVSKFNL